MLDNSGSALSLLAVIQIAGIVSALLVRTGVPDVVKLPCTILYFGLLGLVGLASVLALSISPTTCFVLCVSLAIMVLTATIDLRPAHHVAQV